MKVTYITLSTGYLTFSKREAGGCQGGVALKERALCGLQKFLNLPRYFLSVLGAALAAILVAFASLHPAINLTQTRIGDYVLYEVDIYELAKTYSTTSGSFTVLGVSVKVNFTYPRLLVNDELFTFSYKVVVGNAPQGWQINVTDVTLAGDCVPAVTQKINKVLEGWGQLSGGFTVVPIIKLDPGYTSTLCDPEIRVRYQAVFGQNRETQSLFVRAYPKAKSKELPLRLSLDVSSANVGIRVKNLQNGDISITAIKYCDSYPDSPDKLIGCFWRETSLSDIVVKPGEERLIPLRDFKLENREGYIAFVLQYLHAGGRAENWLVLRVSREQAAGGVGTATQTKTLPQTQAKTLTARTDETKPVTGPVIPDILSSIVSFIFLSLSFPLAIGMFILNNFWSLVALIIGVVVVSRIYSVLKRTKPAQMPGLQRVSLPTGSSELMKVELPESRKLQTPSGLSERIYATLGWLYQAREYYFELKDRRNAVFSLYEAVNGTLNLLLEAEGLQSRNAEGTDSEIALREKVRLLVSRGWISPMTSGIFARLQFLRKLAAHPNSGILLRMASVEEVGNLHRFFDIYILDTIKRLWNLIPPGAVTAKPQKGTELGNAFPLGKHVVVELNGELSCTKCGKKAPISEPDKLAGAPCVQQPWGLCE